MSLLRDADGEDRMFFTYLRRELRRRAKAARGVALGLALGIALAITVSSVSAGMKQAQGKVLQSLYGPGTDMTVTRQAAAASGSDDGPAFGFGTRGDGSAQGGDRVMVQRLQTLDSSAASKVRALSGVADAVGGLSLRVVKAGGPFAQGRTRQSPGSGDTAGVVNGQHGYGGYGGVTGGGQDGSPSAQGGGALSGVDDYSAYGVDVARPELGPLASSKITSGTGFTAAQADGKVAVVDSGYARRCGLAVGQALTVSGTGYQVIGIATAGSGQAAADVYLPLRQAQMLAGATGKVTTLYVRATGSQRIDGVKSAIRKDVPGTTVTTPADLVSAASGSLSTASNLTSDAGRWLSPVVPAAAILLAVLLTSSAVSRRVREFGTLKALGWTSGRVTRQVMGEALAGGLIGGVLGIALGLGAAYAVTSVGPTLTARVGGAGPGGAFGIGAAGLPLHIALTAPVSAATVAAAVVLAVGGGLVAGAFGGWRASRLRPADALRRVG